MGGEFGTGKTVLVLAIVAGCFAVLWPKLIYPMLQSAVHVNKVPADTSSGCCDVIFENDVNAIKIMSEMCGKILHRHDDFDPKLTLAFEQGKLTQEIVATCRKEVLDTCGIDITAFLNDRVRLGKTYKQMLDEIRSFNSSVCLKRNFGVDPGLLGAPHRMRITVLNMPRHHRQERPPHLRPDLLNNHPALQERGRTIPQAHIVPKVIEKEGRPPGPIPGMRPPMGGAGHVVPPPKGAGGGGTMGIIMPLYTIGIVVFFMYTMMKMVFKKVAPQAAAKEEFTPDPVFRQMVFAEETELRPTQRVTQDSAIAALALAEQGGTKLGDIELDQLRKRLEETEAAMERIVAQMGSVPHKLPSAKDLGTALAEVPARSFATDLERDVKTVAATSIAAEEVKSIAAEEVKSIAAEEVKSIAAEEVKSIAAEEGKPGAKVKILGMEMTASCEGGQRWSRPSTPVPLSSNSRSNTPLPAEPVSIFLEGALPAQSGLLVTESETQLELGNDTDPAVVLSGKMTLSLISIDTDLHNAYRDEATPVPEKEADNLDEEEGAKGGEGQRGNGRHPEVDETPTSTNYTTATSAAAEASGPEETAADFSAMESFLPDDQEEEDDLEEEEVWNGDIDSGEEEEESEEEEAEGMLQVNHNQHQR